LANFRPIRRVNLAQLKNSAPSLPAQTEKGERNHTSVANSLANFPAYSADKFSSAEKYGTITASSNYTQREKQSIPVLPTLS
jgi:hypothetical protein